MKIKPSKHIVRRCSFKVSSNILLETPPRLERGSPNIGARAVRIPKLKAPQNIWE